MLTEREWASIIWLLVLAATFAIVPGLRRNVGPAVKALVRSAANPQIVVVVLSLLAWAALCVGIGNQLGLWNPALFKVTAIIVLGFGFPMLWRSIRAASGGALVKQVITGAIGGTAVLAFYLNLASFPLWVELIVQPVVALLLMLSVLAIREERAKPLVPVLAILLLGSFLASFVWTTVTLVNTGGDMDWLETLRSFLLTIWLPVLLTPFFYALAFVAYAESSLNRLARVSETKSLPLRINLAFIIGLRFRVALVAGFDGRYNGLAREQTFRGALRYMQSYRTDLKRRRREEAERVDGLREGGRNWH